MQLGSDTPLDLSVIPGQPDGQKPLNFAKILQLAIYESPGHSIMLRDLYESLATRFEWYRTHDRTAWEVRTAPNLKTA